MNIKGLVVVIALATAALAVDLTVVENAVGADVVLATITKIENAEIFPSDKRILRRIAYVETADGVTPPPERTSVDYGGIWSVNNDNFLSTQESADVLKQINDAFKEELLSSGVELWEELEWKDLNRPLWSALAARLWIHRVLAVQIPTASDIEGQAFFWKNYYNTDGDTDKFIDDVEQLELDESCKIKSDILFVLDTSGSVGEIHFQEVLTFTLAFVEQLDIGPDKNQVGVILFGFVGYSIFNLSDYSDKDSLLNAISNISYIGGNTNTADGLCLMLEGFTEKNGARLSQDDVFRLAVVMTDGMSNELSPRCNWSSTIEMAERVHNFSHPILVFSIGVTDNVNDEELEAIASREEYVTYLANFNQILFRETTDEQTYELCVKTTIPVEIGEQVGSLARGGNVRYELEIPEEGVTVKLCVSEGLIVLYGSYSVPNPNSALHDIKREVIGAGGLTCDDAFIPQMTSEPVTKRQVGNGQSPANATVTFYISLVGVGEQNEFVLDTSEGDNPAEEDDKGEDWPVVLVVVLVAVVLLLLIIALLIMVLRFMKTIERRRVV